MINACLLASLAGLPPFLPFSYERDMNPVTGATVTPTFAELGPIEPDDRHQPASPIERWTCEIGLLETIAVRLAVNH